jgi:hypothetical protein
MVLCDVEHQLADHGGAERIGRKTRRLHGHALACLHRGMKRVAGFRLDADDLHVRLIPGRDAADQAAAAHRNQQRIDARRLILKFAGQRALAFQCWHRVIGVDAHRTCFGDIGFAERQASL